MLLPVESTSRNQTSGQTDLSDEIIAEISDKCSFKKLKLASQTVKDNSLVADEELARKMDQHLYRKGTVFSGSSLEVF